MKKALFYLKISVNTCSEVVAVFLFPGLGFCCCWAHALSSLTTIFSAYNQAVGLRLFPFFLPTHMCCQTLLKIEDTEIFTCFKCKTIKVYIWHLFLKLPWPHCHGNFSLVPLIRRFVSCHVWSSLLHLLDISSILDCFFCSEAYFFVSCSLYKEGLGSHFLHPKIQHQSMSFNKDGFF